eukprot:9180390-Pyramimonas_sp.AAC.1
MPRPAEGDRGMGAIAPVMGHSWAVFLAHSCLTDSIEEVKGYDLGELACGRPTPSVETCQLILMLYIDDYIGFRLHDPLEGDIEVDKEAVKK